MRIIDPDISQLAVDLCDYGSERSQRLAHPRNVGTVDVMHAD
jgi:hypothetical protein